MQVVTRCSWLDCGLCAKMRRDKRSHQRALLRPAVSFKPFSNDKSRSNLSFSKKKN